MINTYWRLFGVDGKYAKLLWYVLKEQTAQHQTEKAKSTHWPNSKLHSVWILAQSGVELVKVSESEG